jgi:large repetitive protein
VKRSKVLLLSGLIPLFVLSLTGCGGSSGPSIGVSVTSSSSGLDQAQTATLTATVTNDSKSAGVQWSVAGGGTLSGQTATSAIYTAPSSVTLPFTATITATSVTDPTKTATSQIKVNPPPVITTTSLPAAAAGVYYSQTLTESGGTSPYKWTITSGMLPAGLSLYLTTGAITGLPTTVSSSSVTFELTDATGATASQAITVTVNPPPPLTVTTTSLPNGTIGAAYSQTLQASGGVPPYSWSLTGGSLPAGLTLSSTGVISGTPTGTVTATSNFTVTVADSQSPAATKNASLSITVIQPPLSVTTTSLPGGSLGTPYSQNLQAIGGTPPYIWSISAGALPTGLTLSNPSTGAITGTPTATGVFNFTAKVTDSATPTAGTATAALSITINAALAITTTSLPGGSVSTAYSATVVASGGTQPYTWTVTSGTLPAGLAINSTTGTISGTPTATGTSDFTVTATDSENPTVKASAALSIVINSASCPNNSTLTGRYAMMLNGWSNTAIATAAAGSFVADGNGNISGGIVDLNDQTNGPTNGTFTGTYCVASNNLATINLTYGGGITGTNTLAAALNSSGTNGSIVFYDSSNRKASGLLRQQTTSAFSTSKITGNYAFGFVGAGAAGSAPRYALAGEFAANGTGTLTGEFDSDAYLGSVANATLSSGNFTVASSGRGTATITFTGQNTLKFVFYVVSTSELLVMEDDVTGNPLLAGQVLQQTGTFTDASLDGTGVIEIQTLSNGTAVAATAGLAMTNGTGSITAWSTDQNLAGTLSSASITGSYSTSSTGRVTLILTGNSTPPVLYLIAAGQAFVVGTNDLSVDFGMIQPQAVSTYNNASLTGAYLGGSLQPADASVNEQVIDLQANGSGSFTGTSEQNGGGGTSTNSISQTYSVSSNGRTVVSEGGSQVGIIYLISDTELVFLPAGTADTNPTLSQLQH